MSRRPNKVLSRSGTMVFETENRPRRRAPNGCCHPSAPTAFKSVSKTTAW